MSDSLDQQTLEATARDIEMTYEMLYAFLTTHPNDAETFEAAWADARRQSSEAIAKHVAEVQRLRAAQAWQPIETHDRSAAPILVALIRDGRVWRVSDAKFSQIGYYTLSGAACHWRTHWLPSPPLPRATAEEEK